jgi:hypothetical protein
MNHPSQEDWIAYLYGETAPSAQETLRDHLAGCPECKAQFEQWRAVMTSLDGWKLPRTSHPQPAWEQPWLKWGLAAALMLGLGLTLRWLPAPHAGATASLRAELLPALRSELRRDLGADLQAALNAAVNRPTNGLPQPLRQALDDTGAATLAAANAETRRLLDEVVQGWVAARDSDRQATLALYDRAEKQRQADLAWLRRDLETVAVFTDARLQNAQQEIGQLASLNRSWGDGSSGGVTPITNPGNPNK